MKVELHLSFANVKTYILFSLGTKKRCIFAP